MSIKYFNSDMIAMSKSRSAIINIKWALLNHTAHLIFLFRIGQDLRKIPFFGKALGLIVEYIIRIIFASDISCKSKIGPGFTIVHGHDIVIGADVIIGKNCKLFNGVTLGNKDFHVSSFEEQPILGNNVTICTGAKILGNITLGDNVVVGANAVVLKSFPPNSVLVGVPAKNIKGSQFQS